LSSFGVSEPTDAAKKVKEVKKLQIGSAVATPGQLVYGYFDLIDLPMGLQERLPVMIVQGFEPGPTFWFTANIHGDELTGVPAIQQVITAELAPHLRGTVVAIPSLNPSGLRIGRREPYYEGGDPNRTFPGYVKPSGDPAKDADEKNHPSIYEAGMGRLFEVIKQSADFLIDLHCAEMQSIPFSIRDRVLYHAESDKVAAEALQQSLDGLLHAFGLPICNEYLAERYINSKLHRSTSGAALNEARIPAFTAELGPSTLVEPQALQAAKTGILNALKWAGLLEGEPEPITSVPVPQVAFNTKREGHPKASTSGLVHYQVRPGAVVQKGDIIATLHDIFGRPIGEPVRTEYDGWVIALSRGLMAYQGATLTDIAIRDDDPLVVPFPSS
jgi:predicted deacylase